MNDSTIHSTPPALPVWPEYTPAQLEQLRELATRRAHALREQAIAELWGGAGALWGDAVDRTRRAADRLAARLRQHTKQRAASAASGAFEG